MVVLPPQGWLDFSKVNALRSQTATALNSNHYQSEMTSFCF
ncbi:Uncharacterised protein [Staphylococcus intermedius NCTC 11048]|uniref:Uncharacterized protein n=1 Tax=Staphylococcus intermedius NCTC 11048 TaxID=1141106 RepID=A0A380G370_STAIN|nr:Uncharacterised protein [Staphylococcus intermedius NCTC 11048]